MLICMAGQMRVGKNVAGEYVCRKLGLIPAAFAMPVKNIFCEAFGKDIDFIEKWKVNKEPPEGFSTPVRQILQFIGDGFRKMQPSVWVDYAIKNNKRDSCYMDGRYINELKRIKEEGGINVLLYRPGFENDDPNGSEAQIRPVVDYFVGKGVEGDVRIIGADSLVYGCQFVDIFVLNNGSIQDLYAKLDNIVIPFLNSYD